MKIKGLVDEDFTNYKKPSMFIIFPKCTWKCDKECGRAVCQNGALAKSPIYDISIEDIVKRYINNPITKAIVCGGLEPFDTVTDLIDLIKEIRKVTNDDIIIYTGYTESELYNIVASVLSKYSNLIIKYGRYIPDDKERYDSILGVTLASSNQHAEVINNEN